MNLVIVESPAKSKTIEKYLGSDYKVLSSKGHIRNLSTKGRYALGVDVDAGFKPDYVVIKGKSKVVSELKKEVKKSDFVYLATDPDREGEAISWHLYVSLGLNDKNYKRIVFNEITKDAVIHSFENARMIDNNLVNSQETRLILDKIIGFRLSQLMQAKTDGKSAGRVQSVALKLIVDREEEINAFIKEEYYTINAVFKDFNASLVKYKNKDIEIKSEIEANEILSKLSNSFNISDVSKTNKNKKSNPPFITSTLQREASSKLGFSSKKTMSIAQKLYEGIALKNETVGLITYMRTDSIRLADEFIKSTYSFIKGKYGDEYVGYVKKSSKTENVQDAHEAIRPTSINRTPEEVKPYLSNDEYKLYKMIYYRALASLMKDAACINTTVLLENGDYLFKVTGQVISFDGYLKVYSEYENTKDEILPPFEEYNSKIIVANSIDKEQHFTKPKPRYSEATLIKEMEELGIGRPSTYATTMETLKTRNYVEIIDKKFKPTEIGIEITKKLQECFSHIINVEYTASMESDLDKIAEGSLDRLKVLTDFYESFEPAVKEAYKLLPKKEAVKTGEDCPECGNPLVIRKGKYGSFTACSNYPACKYIKQEEKQEIKIIKCPNCDGSIIEKKSKKGKIFYGCNNYPTCKTAFWDMPLDKKCPNCNSQLTIKGKKIKCSNCDYIEE